MILGGIGDNRPKKTESQECKKDLSLRDLETLGQKRKRITESEMINGFKVWAIGDFRPNKVRVRNAKGI